MESRDPDKAPDERAPDERAPDESETSQFGRGGRSGDPPAGRRLSADSLARAFDDARRSFRGPRKRPPQQAEPEISPPSEIETPVAEPMAAEETTIAAPSIDDESPTFEPQPAGQTPEPQAPQPVAAAPVPEPTYYEPLDFDDRQPETPSALGEVTPGGLIEAMLFVGDPSGAPLTNQRIASLLRGVSPAEVDELVDKLNRQYAECLCPYEIVTAGGGYALVLREEFDKLRERFVGRARATRLSQAAIEVLAAVAYHEPLTSEQVTKLRGTPSGPILAQLVRRQLLRVERSETKPRVSRYSTTPRFLTLFGLQSLSDLPRSEEVNQR